MGRGEEATVDLTAATFVRQRLSLAVAEAVGELEAQGLITPVVGADGPDLTVTLRDHGYGYGARFQILRPAHSRTYRLLRPYIGRPDCQFLDAELFTRSAADLLGDRGRRCVDEAIAAHRHGLYLTAANMLGAASEAAWYTLGEMLRSDDEDLAKSLESDSTAQVIRLAANRLEQRSPRRDRTTISELRVHAIYLRDLRNYGLHPRSTSDDDREVAFTEPGSAILLMQCRRYFARLRAVAGAAELLP